MKTIYFFPLLLLLAGCSHKSDISSSAARQELDDRYKNRIGSATKSDFTQAFGNAEWCRQQPGGEETCRFYLKKGTNWMGDLKDRKEYEAFDEVIADFDPNGILRSYKANAQR
jgi:hypothetical protein